MGFSISNFIELPVAVASDQAKARGLAGFPIGRVIEVGVRETF
jgi:hypothetical protein